MIIYSCFVTASRDSLPRRVPTHQVTTEMESPNPRDTTDLIFGGRDDSDDAITETEIGHATRESAYLELFHGQSHLLNYFIVPTRSSLLQICSKS